MQLVSNELPLLGKLPTILKIIVELLISIESIQMFLRIGIEIVCHHFNVNNAHI